MPNLYIIAGPNGAGKTTFAREFLPQYADCPHFVNADLIAMGLSPFAPETVAFRAGRLALSEIALLSKQQANFGYETTLSGRGHVPLVRQLKNQGYEIHLFFIRVLGVDLSLSRIKDRVAKGGHNVPEPDVRRRFDRSLENFFFHYRPMVDSWTLFDNSELVPSIIAFEKRGELHIIDNQAFSTLVNRYEQNKQIAAGDPQFTY